MQYVILSGDASVDARRTEAGVSSSLHRVIGPRMREQLSFEDAYYDDGSITPTMGELLWVSLGLAQLQHYLHAMELQGAIGVDVFCDNIVAVECLLDDNAAESWTAFHLAPLLSVCHAQMQALRLSQPLTQIRVRVPRQGRNSTLIRNADSRARRVRRNRVPLLGPGDLREGLLRSGEVLSRMSTNDRVLMMGSF